MSVGTKQWVAPTGHRTVIQLQGVGYQITLLFLGHDRVAHDSNYRCKFELQRGNARINTLPAVIGNKVQGEEATEDELAVATPAPQGDTRTLAGEETFRVMLIDNHGMKASDSDLLGDGGATQSKPDNYRSNNWLRDVQPAVPFRVIVRRLRGQSPVDILGSEKVILEIKDPVEEFAQNDGLRRQFLEKYFNQFNRTGATPDPGDDNAIVPVDGKRPQSGSTPASDVFKVAPYTAPPQVNIAPIGHNNVTFGSLGNATAKDTTKIELTLTAVQENGVNIGIADPVFTPWPAGGDNYRFLLTVEDGGADVRDKVEEGAPVKLFDHELKEIPKPRAYVTGRLTVWRRVEFALVVLVNNTTQADINWADMQNRYARAFVDLVQPPASAFHSLSLAQWRTELQREFDPGNTNPQFSNAANFTPAIYSTTLLPAFLLPTATVTNVENLSKAIIRHGCGQVSPRISPTPDVDTAQNNLPGLFMALHKLPNPPSNVIGSSFGDRCFWFALGSNLANTTWTVSHELGHALYLRHSHTEQSNLIRYLPPPGGPPTVNLVPPHDTNSGSNYTDHDQADAFNCMMSYTGPTSALPCGVCALTLRFYDRPAASQASRSSVTEGLRQAHIVEASVVGGVPQLSETLTNTTLTGGVKTVLAVSRVIPYVNRGANNFNGVVDLTASASPPLSAWTATPAGLVTLAIDANNRVSVTPRARGHVTLNYSHEGVTASNTFDIN